MYNNYKRAEGKRDQGKKKRWYTHGIKCQKQRMQEREHGEREREREGGREGARERETSFPVYRSTRGLRYVR